MQVIISATVQPAQQQQQQPLTHTTEIDVIPWGCAFLIGDAESDTSTVPAGMPGPNMQAAAADAAAPAEAPVLM